MHFIDASKSQKPSAIGAALAKLLEVTPAATYVTGFVSADTPEARAVGTAKMKDAVAIVGIAELSGQMLILRPLETGTCAPQWRVRITVGPIGGIAIDPRDLLQEFITFARLDAAAKWLHAQST